MQFIHVYVSGYWLLLVCGPCDGSPSGGIHHEGRLQARHRLQVRCPHYIQYILHCQLHNYNVHYITHCRCDLLASRGPGRWRRGKHRSKGRRGDTCTQADRSHYSLFVKRILTVYYNGTFSTFIRIKQNFLYFCNGTWYSHVFSND